MRGGLLAIPPMSSEHVRLAMSSPDHYVVLGVPPDADEKTIKRAYRKAARECHPDLPENKGSASAARRFQEVRQAYGVLSDEKKRAYYDKWGRAGVSAAGKDWHASWHAAPNPTTPGGDADDIELETAVGSGVASIFGDLFGADPDVGSSTGGGGTTKDNPWSHTEDGGGRAASGNKGPVKDLWNPELMNREGRASAGEGLSGGGSPWDPSVISQGLGRAAGQDGSTVTNSDRDGVEEASPWRPSIRRSSESEDGASRTGLGGIDYDGLVQAAFDGGDGAVGGPPPAPTRAEINAAKYAATPRVGAVRTGRPRSTGRKRAAAASPGVSTQRTFTPPPSEAAFDAAQPAPPASVLEPDRPPEAPPPETLRLTVSVPFLTALHGGSQAVTFRVPGDDGKWKLERVEVAVPAGVETGTTLRLRGKGHASADGASRGDLLLDLVAEEHPFFRVEGCNIVVDVPITPFEAAGGVRLEVPTVHGATMVSIPPGIRSGERMVLRGLGLPDPDQPGRKGTQILMILLQIPSILSGEQLQLLVKLEESSGFKPREGLWDEV
jgi:DnaJ-class molecular chaperone